MGEGSDWWEVGLVRRHARPRSQSGINSVGHPVHTAGSAFTGSPLSRGRRKLSYKNRAFLDAGALRPFGGFDLLSAVRLHARDLEAPVGAHHRDAVGFHRA